MRTTIVALAASLAFTGAALAQATAPGSAESNMNNPGSVKSNAEKGMPNRDMPAATGTVTAPTTGVDPGSTTVPTTGRSGGSNTSSGSGTPTSR